MHARPLLHVLPQELFVVQAAALPACAHALLRLLVAPRQESDAFVLYASVGADRTLVLDAASLELFPRDALGEVHAYRALEAAHTSAQAVSHALAEAHVTIFFLGTYESDYTLVRAPDLPRALHALQSAFALTPEAAACVGTLGTNPSPALGRLSPRVWRVRVTRSPLRLISCERSSLAHVAGHVLRYIFFPNEQSNRFFLYCCAESLVSLVLSERELAELEGFAIHEYNEPLARLSLDEGPLGFDEPGIVAALTRPLAAVGVPLFQLSSYDTESTLVAVSDLERALTALREAGLHVYG